MDDLELTALRSNVYVCKVVEDMCTCYTYHLSMKKFNLLPMRNSQKKNVDYFQRNACGGHLVFQNEAIFVPREAYTPMKISCKSGECNWCSFPLRALTLKISLCAAVAA